MSRDPRPARAGRQWASWFDRAGAAVLIAITGFVLGLQYLAPNKRTIPVLAAIVVFGVLWRLDIVSGLGLLAIALPFPRQPAFGNTNMTLVLLLLIVWLLRTSRGRDSLLRRTPIDVPLIALAIIYIVSSINIQSPEELLSASARFSMMVSTWLAFYLIVWNLRTPVDLQRFLGFQSIAILLVCLIGIYEVFHPGAVIVPNWITLNSDLNVGGVEATQVRAGSIFRDYELLSEFCAVNALLVGFLMLRAKSRLLQLAHGSLFMLVIIVLFSTVTRGGLIALSVGLLYLVWLVRRRLTVAGMTIAVGMVAAAVSFSGWYVVNLTRAGNVFLRLSETTMASGIIPDSRATVWPRAWERIFEHPFIGHGPNWTLIHVGPHTFWPHSTYLYVANQTGFIGLTIFLWLVWTLVRASRPVTDDLLRGDFVRSYLTIAHVQLIVLLVDEIKIEYLRNETYSYQVWILFALIIAAQQQILRSSAASAKT